MTKKLRNFLTLLLMPIFFSACCLLGHCLNQAHFNISAARYLNPDERGTAKPLVITFYQLANSSHFSQASYEQLMNNPAAVLGNKLIDRQDVEIQPGKTTSESIELNPNTSAIGIVASYQHIGSNHWKIIIPLMHSGKQTNPHKDLLLESRNIVLKNSTGFSLWS